MENENIDKIHKGIMETSPKSKFFGKCIYCNSLENLSDEHALPYAFNGAQVLKKASCDKCANITKKFEQTVLRKIFGEYRYLRGMKSRSKHKDQKKHREFAEIDKGNILFSKVSLDECGAHFALPIFPNLHYEFEIPVRTFEIRGLEFFHYGKSKFLEENPSKLTQYEVPVVDFVRFLSKVAYCYFMLSLDRYFLHTVTNFIRDGRVEDDWGFVGMAVESPLIDLPSPGIMVFERGTNIFCDIKLIPNKKVVYRVLVGVRID